MLLLILSLPFAKPSVAIGGLHATVTDFLYLIVAALLTVTMVRCEARLRWNEAFAILAAYCAAMVTSVLVAGRLAGVAARLASQIYLLRLPVPR